MLKIRLYYRVLCLLLSLAIAFGPPAVSYADDTVEERDFNVEEAMSPGEYLRSIKTLRGGTREEIEKASYAQWGNTLVNVYLMLDPKAIDVQSYQNSVGKFIGMANAAKTAVTIPDTVVNALKQATTWGFKLFPEKTGRLNNFAKNLNRAYEATSSKYDSLLKIQSASNVIEFAKYMKVPSGRAETAAFQQWLYKSGDALPEGVKPLSNLQGAATIVGSVLQVISGCLELKSFADAMSDDPGSKSWGTVKHAIEGTLLIATAIMAFIPPPGVWTVAAVVIMKVWEVLKKVFDVIAGKIQKWHKSYQDSLTFMKELDDEFSAFYTENESSSDLVDDQEKSAALFAADSLMQALEENSPEDQQEIIDRQKELIQNMRAQGILSTYYYQQATAARELPTVQTDLFELWNHRADYMTWKPVKPKLKWKFWETIAETASYLFDSTVQLVSGSKRKLEEDLEEYKYRVYFCPDFALMMYYRNFTNFRRGDAERELPPLLSLIGLRIEETPFNYIPLMDIYRDSFSNWTDDILAEAWAADSFIVGTKEIPLLCEQIKLFPQQSFSSFYGILSKLSGLNPYEGDEVFKKIEQFKKLEQAVAMRLAASLEMKAQLEALLKVYREDKTQNLKDRKVEITIGDKTKNIKLIDMLFKGSVVPLTNDFNEESMLYTGILRGQEKPQDEDLTPEKIVDEFRDELVDCLEMNVNSIGVAGIDIVQLGVQVKTDSDLLAFARQTYQERKDLVDSFDNVFSTDAFRLLLQKGEYLDVKRSGLSDFFSGFDPPIDEMKHEVDNFRKAIEESEKGFEEKVQFVLRLHLLFKGTYQNWLDLLSEYEAAQDELGITLKITANDPDYKAANLDLITEMTPVDPEVELQ